MWSWSHSPEADEKARANLEKLPIGKLVVIWAEWLATEFDNPDTMEGAQFDSDKYDVMLNIVKAEDAELKQLGVDIYGRKRAMATLIWEKMEQLRICTNGGWQAWCCPHGCHLVKF